MPARAGVDDPYALAARATAFAERCGVRPRIRLIPHSTIPGAPYARFGAERLAMFRAISNAAMVGSIARYSGGGGAGAACGQPARRP